MSSRQAKSAGRQVSREQTHEADKMEESLAAMIASAMEKQQSFIEAQFKTLQDRLDNIQKELSSCSSGVRELRDRYSILSGRVSKTEKNFEKCTTKMVTYEEKLADLEDRSRRDNVRIMNLPEGVEDVNLMSYISDSLPVWFPSLTGVKSEIMRVHRIGPPNSTSRPRTVIMKMLRYTDRDQILRASRKSPVKVNGKDIRFSADYSAFTMNRRRTFIEVTNKAQKMGFQTFLLYPAQLKLTRGSTQHIFKSPLEVEDFLSGVDTQVSEEG